MTSPDASEHLAQIAANYFVEHRAWLDWSELKRMAAQRQDTALFDYVRRGDFNSIGHLDGNTKLVLSIEALSRTSIATPLMEDFLWLIDHAHTVYISHQTDRPQLASDTLRQLGTGDDKIALFYALLQAEPWLMNGGGNTSPTEWSYGISDNIYYFSDIQTIDDYLTIKADHFQKTMLPPTSPVNAIPIYNATLLDVDALQADVAQAVLPRLTAMQFSDAVLAASKEFAAVLRSHTDSDDDDMLDGTELVNQAFSILEARGGSRKELLQLAATKNLALGAVGAYRNLTAHERHDLSHPEAMEAIAIFSLLCRRIERLPDQPRR